MWLGLLGPGEGDLEQFEDAPLGVGEPVEHDPVRGVGEAEALEGGDDVPPGWAGRASFGKEPFEVFVAEGLA